MKKLFFFIFILFLINSVKAEETVRFEPIENVFLNYFYEEELIKEQFGFYYLEEKHLYDMDLYEQNKELDLNLKKYLEMINYYGYCYDQRDFYYYYMASQKLIYEALGFEVYFTDIDDVEIDMQIFEQNILENINKKKPNFEDYSLDVRVGNEHKIFDSNGVVEDYEVVNFSNNIIYIEQNDIILQPYEVGKHSFYIKKIQKKLGETEVINYNQKNFLFLGNFFEEEINFNYTVYGAFLFIERVDLLSESNVPYKGTTFEGARYEIRDENYNLIEIVMTGPEGFHAVNNLPLGKLIVKEINPSRGYKADNNEYHTFVDYYVTYQSLVFFGEVINSDLEIEIICDEKVEVVFEIYDIENNYISDFLVKDNNMINLYYGTYIIKQKNKLENYEKIEDFVFVVDENENQTKFVFELVKKTKPETNANTVKKTKPETNEIIEIENEKNDQKKLPQLGQNNYLWLLGLIIWLKKLYF